MEDLGDLILSKPGFKTSGAKTLDEALVCGSMKRSGHGARGSVPANVSLAIQYSVMEYLPPVILAAEDSPTLSPQRSECDPMSSGMLPNPSQRRSVEPPRCEGKRYTHAITRLLVMAAAVAFLAPHAAYAQAKVETTHGTDLTEPSALVDCVDGSWAKYLGPSESISSTTSCNFTAREYARVGPNHVLFQGALLATAASYGDGTLRTRALANITAEPIGDFVGNGQVDSHAFAWWRERLQITASSQTVPAAKSIMFSFTCHATFDNQIVGVGVGEAWGGCGATLDRYENPAYISGTCYTRGFYREGTYVQDKSCSGSLAENQNEARPFVARHTLSASEIAGESLLDIWLNSYSGATANIYGGTLATDHGIVPLSGGAYFDADLGSTMRLLGVQLFDDAGTDITSAYSVTTENGFVVPAFVPSLTAPEPATYLLMIVPLLAIGSLRVRRRIAGR